MLTDKEKKLILTYHKLSKLSLPCLAASILVALVLIPMEMIDDMIIKNQSLNLTPLFIILALFGINIFLYAYSTLRLRWGIYKGKAWKEIVNKAQAQVETTDYSGAAVGLIAGSAISRHLSKSDNKAAKAVGVAGTVASAVGAGVLAHKMSKENQTIIESVAEKFNIRLPKVIIGTLIFFCSLLIAIGSYIPQFVVATQENNQALEIVKVSYDEIKTVLEEDMLTSEDYVHGLRSPYEDGFKDVGYDLTRYFYYNEDGKLKAYMDIDIGVDGNISDVYYVIDIDVSITKEENISRIKKYVGLFNEKMSKIEVSANNPVVKEPFEISESFMQKFLETSYYQNIEERLQDINYRYYTESEEEYDEYSDSYISISFN